MSKLDELIQEYCPNGIKYLPIKKCVNAVKKIKWNDTDGETYQYIDLSSVDRDTHLIMETTNINKENAPSRAQQIVREGDILLGTTRPMLKRYCMIDADYDEQICSTGFCVLRVKDNIVLNRWLYHNISSTRFFDHVEKFQKGASYPAISDADVKSYEIPVPPLPVQEEIVRILDSFTQLTAELQAELQARKKQYEYYLNSYYEAQTDNLVTLESLGSLTRGKRFVHADATETGVPCIHYGELYTYYGVHADTVKSHIREDLRPKMRYAGKGDVVIVGAGENNIDIGVGVAWEGEEDVAVHDACYTLKHSQNSKYISYFLRSDMYHSQIKKYVSEGKICSISATGLGKALIPIPSLEEQDRIVSFLERFDTLCNNISSGLPAEIKLRQIQYEYYRDKLLSFKEVIL